MYAYKETKRRRKDKSPPGHVIISYTNTNRDSLQIENNDKIPPPQNVQINQEDPAITAASPVFDTRAGCST
jgi:hypothetical protein